MKKIVFQLFVVIPLLVQGQVKFERQLNIPVIESGDTLLFPWAGGINFPYMSSIRLNNDTISDIFMFDHHNNRIITFTGTGNSHSSTAWNYSPEYAGQFPPVKSWAFLYDYNCDGKADFFTLSSANQCAGITAYKNITTGTTLQWQLVDSCLKEQFVTITQNIFCNSISLPHFNDIDGDGDMDILGYNSIPDGRILFHKNYSMENFGVCDSMAFVLQSVCYGNFRLNIGGSNKVGCFQCPCRVRRPGTGADSLQYYDQYHAGFTPVEPVYVPSDAAKQDDTISSVYALDLDGDNNKELLIGDIASYNTLMVHNGGTEMDSQDTLFPSYDTPAFYNGFHYHAFLDADNDGRKDLVVMPYDNENIKGIWLYKNTGTNSVPVFNLETKSFLQNGMLDVGEDACPVLFDYDSDGLSDLVISKAIFDSLNGTYSTGLVLYKNTGTPSSPAFEFVTDDFAGLSATGLYFSPTYPAFGDLDNDGDKDMIIGLEDGKMHYYQNIAGAGNIANFQGPVPNYMMIDIGKYATPELYDIDRDGLLDIVSGGQRGMLFYFRNTGTLTVPFYSSTPTIDSLGCIVFQAPQTSDGYTVPFLYDSLGSTRLLVANWDGNIYQYNQIDGNLTGCFNQTGLVFDVPESNRIRFNITVSGGDLNGDSLTDIVIGQSTGGAEVRYQVNPLPGVSEYQKVKTSFGIFPVPVKDEMNIRFYNAGNGTKMVSVFNATGNLVFQKDVLPDMCTIHVDGWSSGIYLIQVITRGQSVSRKIVLTD
jgi:hypothetical protein